jgi:hypothetical protein
MNMTLLKESDPAADMAETDINKFAWIESAMKHI